MKKKIAGILIYLILCSWISYHLIYSIHPRIFIFFSLSIPLVLLIIFYFYNWLKLNHRSLLKQPLFISSVAVPLYMFIIYGLWAWKDHNINLTSTGFNYFLEISKLPLFILASSVPLAAIISNIHRTIQTEAQINSSENKNSIDRYLSHEKNFAEKIKEISTFTINNFTEDSKKYISDNQGNKTKIITNHDVKISSAYLLYTSIYPKSSISITSNYTPDENFKEQIISILNIIERNLDVSKEAKTENPEKYITRLNTISYNTAILLDLLCVECISHVYSEIQIDKFSMRTFTPDEGFFAEALEAAFYLSKKIMKLTYGISLEGYTNMYDYFYIGTIRFHFVDHVTSLQSFYAPEWSSYVSEQIEMNNGGNVAAER